MILPKRFYERDAETVARSMLGAVLTVAAPNGPKRGRIVETEAYLGERDLASHASRGRTKRTATIYGPPATAYVYLIYGMYDMFNVVVASEGDPQAVLVRAVEPLEGLDGARTDGPGRLCRAYGITREHDGASLLAPPITLEEGAPPEGVETGPRVGVDYAGTWATEPLRFWERDNRWVSRAPKPKRR